MPFENYTVRQFEDAWFRNDRTLMDDDEFKTVYTEYIDTAGLYVSEEFDKVSYIHFLNNRINFVKVSCKIQREFIEEFGQPYIENFEPFKDKGYYLKWNDDKEDFLKQIERIEAQEIKYISEVEKEIKELIEIRKKRKTKNSTPKQSRESFVRMLNSLGKNGYKIDRDKTTVEDLAYMIKQQHEEIEAIKSQRQWT
jgi:hypothetical protein